MNFTDEEIDGLTNDQLDRIIGEILGEAEYHAIYDGTSRTWSMFGTFEECDKVFKEKLGHTGNLGKTLYCGPKYSENLELACSILKNVDYDIKYRVNPADLKISCPDPKKDCCVIGSSDTEASSRCKFFLKNRMRQKK